MTEVDRHAPAQVDLDDADALADWVDTLGVSEARLRAAVDAVGRDAEAVRAHLALHP